MKTAVCACLFLGLVAGNASAQEAAFINVGPAFRPGPYSVIKVDPADPHRFVVGSPDGWVQETRDGGSTVSESQAQLPRQYYPLVLRGMGAAHPPQFSRLAQLGRGAGHLFTSMLSAGLPTTRWAGWMSITDPPTEIFDIALSPPGGHGALAGPNGVFISDERMTVWNRALGTPRPKGNTTVGFSVGVDPSNPKLVLAGTSDGLFLSLNGGASFQRHPDKKMLDESVRQIIWNTKDPNTVFLLAGGTVYKSENHGESFEAALSGDSEVNALAIAEEGVYVATQKGLSLYGSDGTRPIIKDEAVSGVVPAGQNTVLATTETALFLCDGEGQRALMHTTSADPFIKIVGTAELAWALTKYEIFRIGGKEPRATRRAKKGPQLLMTLDEVQDAALRHLGIGGPTRTRLYDRWYASFLPALVVEVKQMISNQSTRAFDATFPIGFRGTTATTDTSCCGGAGTTEPQALVMAHWDLSKLLVGAIGNVSNPYGLVEIGLRNFRGKIIEEVRWRYRELRNLCAQLRFPPSDPKTRLLWHMRLEEYAHYIDAMTGKQVVLFDNMEEVDEAVLD